MEDLEGLRIVEEIVEKGDFEFIRPKNDPTYYVLKIISAIDELKRDNIDPEKFISRIDEQEKNIKANDDLYHVKGKYAGQMKGEYKGELEKIEKNRELSKVYKEYEKALEKSRLYDYGDMIMEVVRMLEKDNDLLLRIQEECHYILADEHQDANDAQNRLLELVSSFHENPNLFIVGDEKQAIFRFQGASLANFLYFKKKFPQALLVTLKENYRSTQTILDAAHSLIENNKVEDTLRVKLSANSKNESKKISVLAISDKSAEARFVATEIKKLVSKGQNPEEIAVLVRNNRDAEIFERALVAENISVAKSTTADALDNPYIESFLSFISLLLFCG